MITTCLIVSGILSTLLGFTSVDKIPLGAFRIYTIFHIVFYVFGGIILANDILIYQDLNHEIYLYQWNFFLYVIVITFFHIALYISFSFFKVSSSPLDLEYNVSRKNHFQTISLILLAISLVAFFLYTSHHGGIIRTLKIAPAIRNANLGLDRSMQFLRPIIDLSTISLFCVVLPWVLEKYKARLSYVILAMLPFIFLSLANGSRRVTLIIMVTTMISLINLRLIPLYRMSIFILLGLSFFLFAEGIRLLASQQILQTNFAYEAQSLRSSFRELALPAYALLGTLSEISIYENFFWDIFTSLVRILPDFMEPSWIGEGIVRDTTEILSKDRYFIEIPPSLVGYFWLNLGFGGLIVGAILSGIVRKLIWELTYYTANGKTQMIIIFSVFAFSYGYEVRDGLPELAYISRFSVLALFTIVIILAALKKASTKI